MVFNFNPALLFVGAPFIIALVWARFSASARLAFWLKRSVIWGAPVFVALFLIVRFITNTCTHQADFGFTTCSSLPVTLANLTMTAFVFALMLMSIYCLALLGVGAAIELQTRLKSRG